MKKKKIATSMTPHLSATGLARWLDGKVVLRVLFHDQQEANNTATDDSRIMDYF